MGRRKTEEEKMRSPGRQRLLRALMAGPIDNMALERRGLSALMDLYVVEYMAKGWIGRRDTGDKGFLYWLTEEGEKQVLPRNPNIAVCRPSPRLAETVRGMR